MKSNKNVFSRIGFSLVAIQAMSVVIGVILGVIMAFIPGMTEMVEENSTISMLLSYVPMYVIIYPIGFFILRKLPIHRQEPVSYPVSKLVQYALMCVPIMYLGNAIGSLLSGLLSGGKATNVVEEMITGNIGVEFIFFVLLAPLFEEYLFRKLLIDRTVRFGEKTAVFFSAAMFGLFHGNLFQFFYTFGIGLVWAYLYVKTRKFSYVFCLHALFNFIGGIVPSILLNILGEEGMSALENMDMAVLETMPHVIVIYGIYGLVMLVLVLAGAVILFKNRKNFTFDEAERQEENIITLKTICLNPGMIVFLALMLGVFAVMLFAV